MLFVSSCTLEPLMIFRRYIFTLEGKQMTKSASDPQPIRVPARSRHTFKVDDTHDGPCTIEISTAIPPARDSMDSRENGATEKLWVDHLTTHKTRFHADCEASATSTNI